MTIIFRIDDNGQILDKPLEDNTYDGHNELIVTVLSQTEVTIAYKGFCGEYAGSINFSLVQSCVKRAIHLTFSPDQAEFRQALLQISQN